MADKSSLGILGLVLAAVTAAVMLTALLVVRDHVEGRLLLESTHTLASMTTSSVR
jgi:hypothetical protein